MKNRNPVLAFVIIISMILILASIGLDSAAGHLRKLYTIGDQKYLFEVGNLKEPAYVDDQSGVLVRTLIPDPSDPLNDAANGTIPVEGLQLKVDITAGTRNMTLDLEPSSEEPALYEAVFYPTIPTTYNYTIYGDINGTAFRDTFTCSPAGESEPVQDNSTVSISNGITRIGQAGGYSCFESRSDISFPEQYVSNYELQQMINGLGGSTNSTSMP